MIKPKKDIEIGKNKFFIINDGKKHSEQLEDNLTTESDRQNTDENKTLSNNDESKNNADAPFIMTIEVEEGRNDKIYIYFDSSAEELAFDFCKKNNLDFNSLKYLTEEIGKLIEKLHEKRNAEIIHEVDEEDKISEVNKSCTVKENINNNETLNNISMSKKKQCDESKLITNNNTSNYLKESNIILEKKTVKDNITNIINTNNSLESSTKTKEKALGNDDKMEFTLKDNSNNILRELIFNKMNNTEENIKNKITQTEENEVNIQSQAEYIPTKENYEVITTNNNCNNKLYEYQLYLKQIINKEARKKLGRNYNNSKDNIFNKLYNDSKFRKTKKLSMTEEVSNLTLNNKNVTSSRAKSPNVNLIINNNNNIYNTVNKFSSPKLNKDSNHGERLYYKGVVMKDDKLRKTSQKRAEQEKKSKFTFQPNLDKEKKEKAINSDINNLKNGPLILINNHSKHRLSRNFSPTQGKREEGYLNQFLTECSSIKKDRNIELFELSKGKTRETYNHLYKNSCHSPDLTKNTVPVEKTPFTSEDFIEGPQDFERKKSEKYMKLKQQLSKPSNKIINQKQMNQLTKSKERLKYLKNRPGSNKDLYDTLFNEAKFKRILNDRQEVQNHNFKKSSIINQNSTTNDSLYNKKKVEQFEKIFKLLDQDEDGLISSLNITLKNIPQQLVRIINPIIQLLKEDNIKLNCMEFIKECEYLFENLSYLEKKDLLNFDKFYDQNFGYSGNNMNFVKKVLNRIENNNTNQLTRQKTQSTISVDKSLNPSQIQNMLSTGSNEGRFSFKKDLLNIYKNIKY